MIFSRNDETLFISQKKFVFLKIKNNNKKEIVVKIM